MTIDAILAQTRDNGLEGVRILVSLSFAEREFKESRSTIETFYFSNKIF